MSPEAQRIAIAEACGWSRQPQWDDEVGCHHAYEHKDGRICYKLKLPDYLTDLNAMHAAEVALCGPHYEQFRDELVKITGSYEAISATAKKRAEAFLKTCGLWEESP